MISEDIVAKRERLETNGSIGCAFSDAVKYIDKFREKLSRQIYIIDTFASIEYKRAYYFSRNSVSSLGLLLYQWTLCIRIRLIFGNPAK
jgi:hypothetical protein